MGLFLFLKDMLVPPTNFFLHGTNLSGALEHIPGKCTRTNSEGLTFSIDNLDSKYFLNVSLEKIL